MKELDYGKGYKYAHEFEGHFVRQQNLPDSLKGRQFYEPSEQGFEKQVLARLKGWWPERMNQEEAGEKPRGGVSGGVSLA